MSRRAIGEPLFRILAPLLGVLLVLAALQIVRGGVANALHPNARGHDIIAERLFEALSGP